MALASAGCEMSSSSYTAGPRPQLPGLWAAELASVASTQARCSVMAGGTARPAAAEGEAGHEPGTGWPGPQVAALGREFSGEARARMAGRAGSAYMVNPRCRDGGPAFPDHFPPPRVVSWKHDR